MYRDFAKKVKDICTENAGKEFIRYFKEDGAEVKWTYGRFQTEVDQMVMQLKKGMIHKGDRVLLLAQSSPEAYRMLVALAVYGAVCVILDGEQPREGLTGLDK